MEHRLAEVGVRQLPGQARIQRSGTELVVEVRHSGAARSLRADFVIGATGSVAVLPPGAAPDGSRVLLPRHLPGDAPPPQPLALLGAGVAGTEFATALAHLGLKVQLISPSRQILPAFSETAAKMVEAALIVAGDRVLHGFRAAEVRARRDGVMIVAEDGRSLEAASVLLNVGRAPLLDSFADLSGQQGSDAGARFGLAGDALGGSVMTEGAARRSGGDAARRLLGGSGHRWDPSAEGCVAFSLPPVAAFGPNPDAPTPGVRRRTLDQGVPLSGRLSPESIHAATALVNGVGHLVGLEAIGECAVELLTAGRSSSPRWVVLRHSSSGSAWSRRAWSTCFANSSRAPRAE